MNASIPIPPDIAEELRALELRLTQSDVRRSRAELSKLLGDDFREFTNEALLSTGGGMIRGLREVQIEINAYRPPDYAVYSFL